MFKKLTALAMAAIFFAALIPTASVLMPSEAYANSYNKPPPVKKDIPKAKPTQKTIKKEVIKKGGVSGIKLKPKYTIKNKNTVTRLKKESSPRLEALRVKLATKKVNEIKRPAGIPLSWIVKASDKGGGIQYINPKNKHDRVRIMPGNPNSPNIAQRKPYVKRQIDGKFYDRNGRVVAGDSIEAHIPLESFKF